MFNGLDIREVEIDRERALLDLEGLENLSIENIKRISGPRTPLYSEVTYLVYIYYDCVLRVLAQHPTILCDSTTYLKVRQAANLLDQAFNILIEAGDVEVEGD